MGLKSLELSGFRCFEHAELRPSAGINLVTGKNASGKTSLLEAIFLLGRGRSFRAARREKMIREGSDQLRVVGQADDGRFIGIEASQDGWIARAGGESVTQLAQLADFLAIQLIDPEIHRLVQEGPGERRRFLDWATFHVKHEFLSTWRNYQRALRQRNAALKAAAPDSTLEAWEISLAKEGERLDRFRAETLAMLQEPVNSVAQYLLDQEIHLQYRAGHASGQDLAEALASHRGRDRKMGATQVGPHRADVEVALGPHRARGWVSRGQQKMVAAAMVLGQARVLAPLWGDRGILLVDDPGAELDQERSAKLVELIAEMPFQVFVTALDKKALAGLEPAARFHVEQEKIHPVV